MESLVHMDSVFKIRALGLGFEGSSTQGPLLVEIRCA